MAKVNILFDSFFFRYTKGISENVKLIYLYSYSAVPDNKVHGANMGPTWVLSAPDGPLVGPMNLAIRGLFKRLSQEHHTG